MFYLQYPHIFPCWKNVPCILCWLIELVVVFQIRRGREAVLPDLAETEQTANLIQVRIKDELGDEGNGGGLDSESMARRLAGIIDDYTSL